jgi:hypothetical protein
MDVRGKLCLIPMTKKKMAVMKKGEFRRGCELSVDIELTKKDEIARALAEYGIESLGIVPL